MRGRFLEFIRGHFVAMACACICQLILWVFADPVEAQYQYRRDDIAVNINALTTILPIIDLLDGASYEFYYHNNGAVCPTPHIAITVDPFDFTGSGSADLTKGTSQAYVRAFMGVTAEVSECLFQTVSAQILCDSNIVPLVGSASSGSISIRPLCALGLNGVPVMFFFTEMTGQYPITIPDKYDVTLPKTISSNGLTIDVAFAEYKNGVWTALPSPLDKKRSFPARGRAIFGTSPLPTVVDPSNYIIKRGGNLIFSATVRPDEIVSTSKLNEELANIVPWSAIFGGDPWTVGFIRIRDSLIAPRTVTTPTDPRFGILGGLFPLQIQATYVSDKVAFPISVKMVLGSLTVKFDANSAGKPLISAAISVDVLEVTNGNDGTKIPASIKPSITLEGPRITKTGELRVDVKNLSLNVRTKGSVATDIPFGQVLQKIINSALPNLLDIHLNTSVSLPQCLKATDTDSRIDAVSPCTDYKNATAGYMSRASAAQSVSLAIDLTQTTISASTGVIEFDIDRPHQ